MEYGDDEFDELYADVEMQASTAIKLKRGESENVEREGEVGSEDDSDDDFKIVLNDNGDNKGLENGGFIEEIEEERGNGAKYARPHISPFSNYARASGSVKMAYRVDWDTWECNQNRFSNSFVAQSGYNFSLPRHRTILDVNIDAFEQKLWRNPGADASEFFNFGFDETSWKRYCNGLENHALAENERSSYEAVAGKTARVNQTGSSPLSSDLSNRENQKFEMLKDQVIQVEYSYLERIPSTDVRDFVERDSDFIEIVTQDQALMDNDAFGSGKDEPTSKNSSDHEASEEVGIGVSYDKEISLYDDESSVDLLENHEGSARTSSKRSSRLTTPSNTVSEDSDYHLDGQIFDSLYNQKATDSISIDNSQKTESHYQICSNDRDGASIYQKRSHTHLRKSSDPLPELERRGRSPCETDWKHYKGYDFSSSSSMRHRRGASNYDYMSYYRNKCGSYYEEEEHSFEDYHKMSFCENPHRNQGGSYYREKERSFKDYHKMSFCENSHRNQGGSYRKEKEHSFEDYHKMSFCENPRRNHHRYRDGKEHFAEQRTSRGGDEAIQWNWHHHGTGKFFAKYSSFSNKNRRFQGRRGGDGFQFRKRTKRDDFMPDHNHQDDLRQDKCGYYSNKRKVPDYADDARFMSNEYDFYQFHSRFRKNHNGYIGRGRKYMYDQRRFHGDGRHNRFDDDYYFHYERGSISAPYHELNSVGRHWLSKSSHWVQDGYVSRLGYGEFFDKETRFHDKRSLVNDRELNHHRFNPTREWYRDNYSMEKSPNVSDEEFDDMQRKSSSADRTIWYTDNHEDTHGKTNKKLALDVDNANREEIRNYHISPDYDNWFDKFPITDPSDPEIGDPLDNNFDDDVDNSWILEAMAKMEQRRERFKEPAILEKESEMKLNQTVLDPVVEMKNIHGRPMRKRRWDAI